MAENRDMDVEVVRTARKHIRPAARRDGLAQLAQRRKHRLQLVDARRGCVARGQPVAFVGCGACRRGSVFGGAEAEGQRGEGGREVVCGDLGGADRGEEGVELGAVEGAEFHVALDYAVEVDFLCLEVVEPGCVSWRLGRWHGAMYRVSPLEGRP